MRKQLVIAAAALLANPASASRIKDVASVVGMRSNPLIGYGLVVGLPGTGDRLRNTPFTQASLNAMLERFGVNVGAADSRSQNVAAVMVTASLPALARAGTVVDVQISAIGDATNLQGGTLVATVLNGLDGQAYAVAQGAVAVSGFAARGQAASVTKGAPTSARIAGGAIVEKEVPYALPGSGAFRLALRNPDFVTARRVADVAVRAGFRATAIDHATIEVDPAGRSLVDAVAEVESLPVAVDQPARVVIDEASGTVIMGDDVRVSRVAVAHGGLTVTVSETPVASQPRSFSDGETVVLPRTAVDVADGAGAQLAIVDGTVSLASLVRGLNALGVSPRDLITILQALRTAGALQAEIVAR